VVGLVYRNFDIHLTPGEQGYRVQVFNAPAGDAVGDFQPPAAGAQLAEFSASLAPGGGLGRNLLPTPSTAVSTQAPVEGARALGTQLFNALFAGSVGMCLRRSIDKTSGRDERLRVRLRLSETPELSSLPWEYLFDSERYEFLCLSDRLSLVRYPDQADAVEPLAVEPPLRIMVMVAQPVDAASLEIELEWQTLTRALQDLTTVGRVELQRCGASLAELVPVMRQQKPHVFHFIGHGMFDRRDGGQLLLEGPDGRGQQATAEELGALLVGQDSVRLVLLNACETGRSASDDPIAGAAQRLVRMGLPAVIAMQSVVTDPVAIAFTHQFYAALADGYPVDAAVTEGRKAIFVGNHGVEWGTPVLYLRASDTQLFKIEPEAESERVQRRAATLDQQAAIEHATERWDGEIAALEALVQVDPTFAGVTERLKEAHRQREVGLAYAKGQEYFEAGRWREALAYFNRVNDLGPGERMFRSLFTFIATAQTGLAAESTPAPKQDPPPARDPLQEHCANMVRKLVEGRLVVVLGTGANLCGRPSGTAWHPEQFQYLPSHAELATYLARDLNLVTLPAAGLEMVSQYFATVEGPGALREAVRRLFDADYSATPLHRLLATLPRTLRDKGYPPHCPVLVTTSYDDVLERALTEAGEQFDLLTYVAGDADRQGKFVHRTPDGEAHTIEPANEYRGLAIDRRVLVVKVHGAIDRGDPEGDSYVIAEDDYIDYASGRDIATLIPATLLSKLRNSHLLFLGYSPGLWSLRVFLHRIWRELHFDRFAAWAASSVDHPVDERFWRRRGVDVLNMSLESFVAGLEVELQALPAASAQHR